MKKLFLFSILLILFNSCKTVNFDNMGSTSEPEKESVYGNLEQELKDNEESIQEYLIEEKLKEVDVEKTIVYVEKPVYYPANEKLDKPNLTGKEAARESTSSSMQSPSKWTHGTMYYDFDPDFTYEIYCQPYRVTDLQLEPGEQVIEMPFLSESQVWEIGAGVSRVGGIDTQHFFLKPAYSGLETSFIIITDKRIYHLMLKSFKDVYMTQVKWEYPNTMPFKLNSETLNNTVNKLSKETLSVDPTYLSFDYKMTHSIFKTPYWLPQRVYDDGKRTYIVMDETVLHMTSPVLFNKRNERINYSVNKNLIIINELIEKVTLRVGNEKVTIKKSNYKEPKEVVVEETEKVELIDTNSSIPEPEVKQFIHSPISKIKEKEEKEAVK